MKTVLVAAIAIVIPALAAMAQTTAKGAPVVIHANGTFDVKINPQPPDDYADGKILGRMTIDKQYHGDIEGSAKGQMLTAMGEVKGSAAYVATERVTGKVNGRSGSFAFVHRGVMSGGSQQLEITVVPDSGTGELVGIAGRMAIKITDGKHYYDFEYTLPPQ